MTSHPVVPISEKPRAIADLLRRLGQITAAAEDGFCRVLDDKHSSAFVRRGDTLMVTFERAEEVCSSDTQLPFGHELMEAFGWSTLTLIAEAQTWFRSTAVYEFIDALSDDGFFDDFDRVLFFGTGTSGHAACAFSVASPGAEVLAISPQATLDPLRAAWDQRFVAARRLDFNTRYGYAPAMCEAARAVHIFFDPKVREDASHAAQFNADHISLHRLRYYGENPAQMMSKRQELTRLMALLDEDDLTPVNIARVLRRRRDNTSYLRRLLTHLTEAERLYLSALLCRNVIRRHDHAPRFQRRLEELTQALEDEGRSLPNLKSA